MVAAHISGTKVGRLVQCICNELDVQLRAFVGVDDADLLYSVRDDDYLMFGPRRFF